jgi:hypothetical protein
VGIVREAVSLKNNQTNQTRGGRRPNAGRKPGIGNKSNEEARRLAAETGETPLAYMLRIMRDDNTEPQRRDDMAKAAAPYVHAKLASVEHSGKIDLRKSDEVTDDELANIATRSSEGAS